MGSNETVWLGKEFINSLCPKLSNKFKENFVCVNKNFLIAITVNFKKFSKDLS
jgi:hypothetical protein